MKYFSIPEPIMYRFGLPGRSWSPTPRSGYMALIGLVVPAAVILAGAGATASLGHQTWVVVALLVLLGGAQTSPIIYMVDGMQNEILLEGGIVVLALHLLGPWPALAFWAMGTLVVELVMRPHVSVAIGNAGIATLAFGGAMVMNHLIDPAARPATTVTLLVHGALVAAAYTLVEALVSDAVSTWLAGEDGFVSSAGRMIGQALVGAVTSAALGALAGGVVAIGHPGLALVALGLPLLLVDIVAYQVMASGQEYRFAEALTDAMADLATARDVETVDRIVLAVSPGLAAAAQADILDRQPMPLNPPDGSHVAFPLGRGAWGDGELAREHRDSLRDQAPPDLCGPAEIDIPVDGGRWLRVVVNPYVGRLRPRRIEAFTALAKAARAATARINDHERMVWFGDHDPLTGLLSRPGFWRRVGRLDLSVRTALLVIDLDHFKQVNDRLGHTVGDDVLTAAGDAVRAAIGPDAAAVRWGGDELVVLIPGRPDIAGAELTDLGERIIAGIETSCAAVTGPMIVSASIGYAVADPDVECGCVHVPELIDGADEAMYVAKRAGRGTVRGITL